MMGPKLSIILLDELNRIRRRKGLHKLKWDRQLYEWAVWWAKCMYTEGWFGHIDPDTGRTLFEEKGMVLGECLHKIYEKGHRPNLRYGKEAIKAWLRSKKGHRAILLFDNERWTGAAFGAYGNIYVFLITNYERYLPPDIRP